MTKYEFKLLKPLYFSPCPAEFLEQQCSDGWEFYGQVSLYRNVTKDPFDGVHEIPRWVFRRPKED